MASNSRFFGVFLGVAFTAAVSAQALPPQSPSSSLGVVVFPAKGQSAQQQSQDEGECYAWSKGQTGIDPTAPPPAAAPPPQQAAQPAPAATGSRVRGAARGAAAGAIVGEIASDDAGKGAAIGATAGTLKGGADARKQKAAAEEQASQQQQQAAEQASAQQQAAAQQQKDTFNKGFAACLEAKGYTVK
jgi:uncharacterized protein YcfJ